MSSMDENRVPLRASLSESSSQCARHQITTTQGTDSSRWLLSPPAAMFTLAKSNKFARPIKDINITHGRFKTFEQPFCVTAFGLSNCKQFATNVDSSITPKYKTVNSSSSTVPASVLPSEELHIPQN